MDIEIIKIKDPYIYSVKYEGREQDEFHRLFGEWNEVEYVLGFMERNSQYLKAEEKKNVSEPESAASQVFKEADELEDLFDKIYDNTMAGAEDDFDNYFKCLDGDYKFEIQYVPMKAYGTFYPSFLRLYAIKIDKNTYIITGGGIKLSDKIQTSPELKDHVLKEIDIVRRWLRNNGIDIDDLMIM